MRNIYLDNFKKDIADINETLREISSDVRDIADDGCFTDEQTNGIRKRLLGLKREILRVSKNSNGLEEYIINGVRFTDIKIRLGELLSGFAVLDNACKHNLKVIYSQHLDGFLSILLRVSDNIYTYSRLLESEDVIMEETDYIKSTQNIIRVIKG